MADSGQGAGISVLTEFLEITGQTASRPHSNDPRMTTSESQPEPYRAPIPPETYPVIEQIRRRMSSMGDIMKLEIVWRNPMPPRAMKLLVRQIIADAYGALYEVRSANDVKVFEILERAA
jgi:hypothetical protein